MNFSEMLQQGAASAWFFFPTAILLGADEKDDTKHDDDSGARHLQNIDDAPIELPARIEASKHATPSDPTPAMVPAIPMPRKSVRKPPAQSDAFASEYVRISMVNGQGSSPTAKGRNPVCECAWPILSLRASATAR